MSDAIITGVKLSVAIAAGLAFIVALNGLISFLFSLPIAGTDFMYEVYWVMSAFLPFDTNIIMLSVFEAMAAITAFLISQQVYKMTMLTYKVA